MIHVYLSIILFFSSQAIFYYGWIENNNALASSAGMGSLISVFYLLYAGHWV